MPNENFYLHILTIGRGEFSTLVPGSTLFRFRDEFKGLNPKLLSSFSWPVEAGLLSPLPFPFPSPFTWTRLELKYDGLELNESPAPRGN